MDMHSSRSRDAQRPLAEGAIDSLEVGDGFAVVAGWASQLEGAKHRPALIENASRMELLVGGAAVVGPSPRPDNAAAEGSDPAGYVDFYGHVPDFGGYLLAGWMSGKEPDNAQSAPCSLRFASGECRGEALIAWHSRSDVEGFGWGFVCFLHGERIEAPFTGMEIDLSGRRLLHPSNAVREIEEVALVSACMDLLRARPVGLLQSLLRQPLFNGRDTLAELAAHLQIEIDEFIVVPGDGALLKGWIPGAGVSAYAADMSGEHRPG
jgi:hypothetical protein